MKCIRTLKLVGKPVENIPRTCLARTGLHSRVLLCTSPHVADVYVSFERVPWDEIFSENIFCNQSAPKLHHTQHFEMGGQFRCTFQGCPAARSTPANLAKHKKECKFKTPAAHAPPALAAFGFDLLPLKRKFAESDAVVNPAPVQKTKAPTAGDKRKMDLQTAAGGAERNTKPARSGASASVHPRGDDGDHQMASEFLSLFDGLAITDHPSVGRVQSMRPDVATVLHIHKTHPSKLPLAIVHLRKLHETRL